jgi:hypothetical protein
MLMLILLNNMNIKMNHRKFRVYPEEGPVRHSQDWILCRSRLFDVAELGTCSIDCRRKVVGMILMLTRGIQLHPPGTTA